VRLSTSLTMRDTNVHFIFVSLAVLDVNMFVVGILSCISVSIKYVCVNIHVIQSLRDFKSYTHAIPVNSVHYQVI
jgi:hypothetical protein